MTEFVERRCRECGRGTIRLAARPGRPWRYKGLMFEVPADFQIPTCSECGEEWLDPEKARALEELLQVQYVDRLTMRFQRAVAVLARSRSQRELERMLGLSQGYLSKVLSRKKMPSEALVANLVLIAKSPAERLRDVEIALGSVSPPWLAEDERV